MPKHQRGEAKIWDQVSKNPRTFNVNHTKKRPYIQEGGNCFKLEQKVLRADQIWYFKGECGNCSRTSKSSSEVQETWPTHLTKLFFFHNKHLT